MNDSISFLLGIAAGYLSAYACTTMFTRNVDATVTVAKAKHFVVNGPHTGILAERKSERQSPTAPDIVPSEEVPSWIRMAEAGHLAYEQGNEETGIMLQEAAKLMLIAHQASQDL
eukprot:TRINITY_DN311_c0_g2_i1.p3 TRINITY_DN311_c0_g2~~TRINITY_DN311_c0_g2_i1.p3  ORF type:complete len:115 (+),score=5.67 TRINITY_DN311_c0_g2_i1:64-408(+)